MIVHLNEDQGTTGVAGGSGGPRIACGVIELIVGGGHDEHRATGTHRQPGRPDASSMNNHSRPWEQFRKGRIVAGDHPIGQRCRAVAGILPDDDHGPETEATVRGLSPEMTFSVNQSVTMR